MRQRRTLSSGLLAGLILAMHVVHASGEEETRTWTSRVGSTVDAKFVRFERGRVTLEKPDGKLLQVPMESLAPADQQHVARIVEMAKQEEQARAASQAMVELGLKSGQQVVDVPKALAQSKSLSPKYLLYLPEEYGSEARKWPLVLFLHGAGERGTNVMALTKHGPPKLAEKRKFPFILVSPQCRADSMWESSDLMKLLEHVESTLAVDESRIYVTGLSMGGYGTWNMITEYPEKFAAAIPICGGAPADKAKRIEDMPIWAFHGDQDKTVPMERVRDMVDRLKGARSKKFKFTVYEGCGHDSWTRTYDNDEVYEWLLDKKK